MNNKNVKRMELVQNVKGQVKTINQFCFSYKGSAFNSSNFKLQETRKCFYHIGNEKFSDLFDNFDQEKDEVIFFTMFDCK